MAIGQFESNVIYIGTKTESGILKYQPLFESNVIYIGTKTDEKQKTTIKEFESNVIYIGTKTFNNLLGINTSLRVM